MDMGLAIYCADVGSVSSNKFGWAHIEGKEGKRTREGTDMACLAADIAGALGEARKVALGFECPLWVPVASDPKCLTRAREVDGNRAWSATAGSGALATGLAQVPWILRRVRRQLTVQQPQAYLDWETFSKADSGLFLWEAFVAGEAKAPKSQGANGHSADAMVACKEFADRLPDLTENSAPKPAGRVRSLIGDALLWAGWSTDMTLLYTPCLVVRPKPASAASQVTSLA